MRNKNSHVDLEKFRTRIAGEGREYWKSLDELCEDPEFQSIVDSEFPQQALNEGGVDRRNFLKLMSASMALGGLAGCSRPIQTIVPYVRKPEDMIPGKPLFFATAMTLGGAATGVLVESHEGRPTKIEGNPDHPASLGASDTFAQASILNLYDPDRSQTVRYLGDIATWSAFLGALQPILQQAKTDGGTGLRVLTESITSPTLGAQLKAFQARFPNAIWHQYEPASHDNVREGARLAFGAFASTVYRFDQADVVVSLDSNFLSDGPAHLRYTKDFMSKRRVRQDKKTMNRLYAAQSSSTTTSSIADHRFPMKASDVEPFARSIAAALGLGGAVDARFAKHATAIAKDLNGHRGTSIVIAGEDQPAAVHAIAHAINGSLGNAGRTVMYIDPVEANPVNQLASMKQLAADMAAGQVKALVMFGGNPAFTAPADFGFAAAMQKVPFRAHLASYYDETSALSHWHLPEAHYLESWGDTRAYDGTVSIVQPLIAPLYNGRTHHDVIGALIEDPNEAYEAIRSYWQANAGGADFEKRWKRALNDGLVAGSALPQRAMSAAMPPAAPAAPQATGIELLFRHDPTVYDGRFANNGWLQELPKPITKITWDNVLHLSPATAARLGLANEDVVKVDYRGRSMTMPVWIVPGHGPDCATVYFGLGRNRGGNVANGVGRNVYAIRTSDAAFHGAGATLTKTGEKYRVATTQHHQELVGESYDRTDLVKSLTIAQFAARPELPKGHEVQQPVDGGPTFYPAWKYDDNKWGMVIDMNVCTGCNGCVVACQAENNIPIVGRENVLVHREMHWLRIDHYFKGSSDNPQQFHQPIPCMHCENAPCEPVCPVGATTHSPEGINEMTYNRCVGTRYCANNCPYKVRRFNFFEFSDYKTPSLALMRNPDVTVRTRGVMEKCSYCVQRVNAARIESEKESRPVRDGEATTACQQACAAEAIVFGNMNDPNSRVAKLKKEPLHYGLLTELNTQPRTTYLAALRNPNPEITE